MRTGHASDSKFVVDGGLNSKMQVMTIVRPHPCPLPQERENHLPAMDDFNTTDCRTLFAAKDQETVTAMVANESSNSADHLSLSPQRGEGRGEGWEVQQRLSTTLRSFTLAAAAAIIALGAGCQSGIVKRPEQLTFAPLDYKPPTHEQYRVTLKSGPVAYVVPDRELPLVNIVIYVRTGEYLEPAGKEGLAGLTGYLLTRGGTKSKTAEALEERLAYLAAQLGSGVGDTQGSVSLNLLSKDLDEGLGILREVLTAPRFQDDKIALRKQQLLQGMKQRNDDSAAIEGRELGFLAYGENFWANHYDTAASIESVTREDIEAFHKKWFHPGNFVVAVNGDFDRDTIVRKLETLFADWPSTGEKPPPIPTNTMFAAPGIYLVDKDVNQGRVTISLPGVRRDNPDYFSIMVMNDILGGGGFTSHIMNSVRSDEGLAYDASSSFPGGVYYPLTFTAEFQSKSRTVAYAVSIVLNELKKMAETPPTDKELDTSKRGYIFSRLPGNFATKARVASVLAQEEFSGRYAKDPEFWQKFRDRINAVTAADVQRVAKKYLAPDQAVILVVGQKDQVLMTLPDHPVELKSLSKGGFTELPLRDPLTMKPMAPTKEPAAK
jgi:zinc protease